MRQQVVDALVIFQRSGHFTLEATRLDKEDLRELHRYFIRYGSLYTPYKEVSLQFYWNRVTLEEAPEARVAHNQLRGVAAEEEFPPLLRRGVKKGKMLSERLSERFGPFSLLSDREQYLLSLLDQLPWKLISLERIRVMGRESERPLGGDFLEGLREIPLQNWSQVKELSLIGVDLSASRLWLSCLNQARQLQKLRLEDVDQRGLFLSKEFCHELNRHPALSELDLGRSQLEHYRLLTRLFDRNYRINRLVLAEPESLALKRFYKKLMKRVEQPSWQRFQQERLTVTHKAELVEVMMKSKASLCVPQIEGKAWAIDQEANQGEGQEIPGDFFECLPEIFREYPEYFSRSWPLIFLSLGELLPTGETLGSYLLEKAYTLDRPDYMVLLLKAGANLLEEPKEEDQKSLVKRLLLDKTKRKWSQLLKEYLQQDLTVFMPELFQFLEPYQEVSKGLEDVKKQLDGLLAHLLKQLDIPFLLRIFRVGFESKQSIYETDLRLLLEAGRGGMKEGLADWFLLHGLGNGLKLLLERIQETKGSLFKGYQYHKGMQGKVQELLETIDQSKKPAYENDLAKKEQEMKAKLVEQRTELETVWARDKVEQKAELEVKLAGQKVEFEMKLAESDLMRTRDREEFETKLAESDLMRTRDKEEFETKLAENYLMRTRDKEEFETKLAENYLMRTRDKEEFETKLVESERVIETKLVDFSEFFLMKLKEVQGGGLISNLTEGAVGGHSAFFRGPSDVLVRGKNAVNNQEPKRCGNS